MANRSYIYASTFDKTKGEKQASDKIISLGEYNYCIPLAFKILVSQQSQICKSNIWQDYNEPISIQGNFNLGKEKLFKFLDIIYKENLFDKNELKNHIKLTKAFFKDIKHCAEYIILECGEIYDMDSEKLEEQNKRIFEKDILRIDTAIENCIDELKELKKSLDIKKQELEKLKKPKGFIAKLLSKNDKKNLEKAERLVYNLEGEMWRLIGIDNWCDYLYYDFSE